MSHTSDHFAAILKLQTRMIEEGLAYVDPSPHPHPSPNPSPNPNPNPNQEGLAYVDP